MIESLKHFRLYCKKKGYYPFICVEKEGDGYYMQVLRGEGKVEDFSNIIHMAEPATGVKGIDIPGIDKDKFEWCRLSIKDIDNKEIVGDCFESSYL